MRKQIQIIVEFLIVESARLRATLKVIRERLWAACSNERRVPFRDIAGDSLDRPAADASLRLGRSLSCCMYWCRLAHIEFESDCPARSSPV
jgi:hypothetical protein